MDIHLISLGKLIKSNPKDVEIACNVLTSSARGIYGHKIKFDLFCGIQI